MTWEHVITKETFPIEQDTEIKLECEAGYTLQGSNTVTCKQDLQYTFGLQPTCEIGELQGNIKFLSRQVTIFSENKLIFDKISSSLISTALQATCKGLCCL